MVMLMKNEGIIPNRLPIMPAIGLKLQNKLATNINKDTIPDAINAIISDITILFISHDDLKTDRHNFHVHV